MTIADIIKNGTSINVTMSKDDLQELLKETVRTTKMELEASILADKAEKYLSPNSVCKILDVHLTTLWRWSRKQYLVPIEIGGRRKYLWTEVKALLDGGRLK